MWSRMRLLGVAESQLEEVGFSKERAPGQGLLLPGSNAVLSVNKTSLEPCVLVKEY